MFTSDGKDGRGEAGGDTPPDEAGLDDDAVARVVAAVDVLMGDDPAGLG
jgi:hypothetical protein